MNRVRIGNVAYRIEIVATDPHALKKPNGQNSPVTYFNKKHRVMLRCVIVEIHADELGVSDTIVSTKVATGIGRERYGENFHYKQERKQAFVKAMDELRRSVPIFEDKNNRRELWVAFLSECTLPKKAG